MEAAIGDKDRHLRLRAPDGRRDRGLHVRVRAGDDRAHVTGARLEELLEAPPPATVPEVIATMRAIEEALPRDDGVAAFTYLYRSVTEAVQASLAGAVFNDPRVPRTARRRLREPLLRRAPPLVQRPRHDSPRLAAGDRAARQAGPRAAAVRARRDERAHQPGPPGRARRDVRGARQAPRLGGPQHEDYMRVNALLAATEAQVKADFARGVVGVVDRTFGDLDDVVAMWNVAPRPRRRLGERRGALGTPRRRRAPRGVPRLARPDGRLRRPRAARAGRAPLRASPAGSSPASVASGARSAR